jgi:hypothetical protein
MAPHAAARMCLCKQPTGAQQKLYHEVPLHWLIDMLHCNSALHKEAWYDWFLISSSAACMSGSGFDNDYCCNNHSRRHLCTVAISP